MCDKLCHGQHHRLTLDLITSERIYTKTNSHQPAMDISLITGVYDDYLPTSTAVNTNLSDIKGKGKEKISGMPGIYTA